MTIHLGDCVRDTVSGFVGIVVAKADYRNGTTKYCIEAVILDNGKMLQEVWLDAWRVEATEQAKAAGVGFAPPATRVEAVA
mgnify:FL=1